MYLCENSTTKTRCAKTFGSVRMEFTASAVTSIETAEGNVTALQTSQATTAADYYISALPFERLRPLMPDLPIPWEKFEHSPITGIHLWFDRPVTDLPHATLLDRTIQWMFNKSEGRYIQVVVSASRTLLETPRNEVIDLAVRELAEFFPAVKEAKLEKAQVIKEVRATFSAKPGMEALRPLAATPLPNFFLAGDWTRSGWPATMEVRSPQRLPRRGSGGSGRRIAPAIPPARYRIIRPMIRSFGLLFSAPFTFIRGHHGHQAHRAKVNSADTGKPIDRADVIVRFRHGLNPVKMKKILTSWETKTNQMGSVTIPEIPVGEITIQIIADHYQTFGDVFELTTPEQTIPIKLNAPQQQYSEDSKTK